MREFTPSAFGTSPKSDGTCFESAYKIFIVGFGGGWEGVVFIRSLVL